MEEIKKMKIGDPLDRSTDHGPQNHKAHLEKLLQYCETGVKEGATLVYGGRQVCRPGKILFRGVWNFYTLNKSHHDYLCCIMWSSSIMGTVPGKPKIALENIAFKSRIKRSCAAEA